MATAHDLHPRPLWDGEVATRGRDGLHRLALAVPWPDPPNRMICSEVGRLLIESVFTADALPGLLGVEPSMTAPGDLLQELLHRCDRGTEHAR